jgi:hypothetical protein
MTRACFQANAAARTEAQRDVHAGLPSTAEGRTKPARSPVELSVGERAVVRDVTATFGRLNLPEGEQDHGRVLAVHASRRGE